jgi:hypothetical protein
VITVAIAPSHAWNAQGIPELVAAWAISGDRVGPGSTITLGWWQWGLTAGTRLKASARLEVPRTTSSGPWVMGITHLPAVLPQATTLGLVASNAAGGMGGSFLDHLPPPDISLLAVSDPILGQANNAVIWRDESGNEVLISPLATFARKSTVELAYQIRQETTDTSVTTRLRVLGESTVTGNLTEPLLSLRFSDAVVPGVQWMRRTLDMPDLPAGSYALELAVAGVDGVFGAARVARFELK